MKRRTFIGAAMAALAAAGFGLFEVAGKGLLAGHDLLPGDSVLMDTTHFYRTASIVENGVVRTTNIVGVMKVAKQKGELVLLRDIQINPALSVKRYGVYPNFKETEAEFSKRKHILASWGVETLVYLPKLSDAQMGELRETGALQYEGKTLTFVPIKYPEIKALV